MSDWSHECWMARLNCRLTQQDWAAVSFVSPNTISRWETGRTEPPEYVKERLRAAWAVQYDAYLAARDAMKH